MQYPSIPEYDKAIRNFKNNVRCQQFQGCIPELSGIDLVAHTGGYSRIYSIKKQKGLVGLRCWLGEVDGQKPRYIEAYNYLKNNPCPYFVDFEYIDQGILVNRKIWPILYMEWADGIRLNKFLDLNVSKPQVIKELSIAFLDMVKNLHRLGISHGDLQDGNILVQKTKTKLTLRLIDYDTLYVPTMKSIPEICVGVPEFQPPKRDTLNIPPKSSDYFSELVIYLSLLAFVEKPELWKIGRSQQLLFSIEDFLNPDNSTIFKELQKFSDDVKFISQILQKYCKEKDLRNILPIEKLLSKKSFDFSTKELDQYFNIRKE